MTIFELNIIQNIPSSKVLKKILMINGLEFLKLNNALQQYNLIIKIRIKKSQKSKITTHFLLLSKNNFKSYPSKLEALLLLILICRIKLIIQMMNKNKNSKLQINKISIILNLIFILYYKRLSKKI
ncbi:unnamed protein product [Paramecium sonneborni]|uniref:Uncharacterized protein n=1 Tax=Paramecium sonneborni TaxID=65129 RepID=A0A8S1QRW1_9CILI|nr:unnamed protein product [Paramecium sonneborni]